ncbi:hypothetical protein RI129_007650, partial [Pyrocoelia pectoralis]
FLFNLTCLVVNIFDCCDDTTTCLFMIQREDFLHMLHTIFFLLANSIDSVLYLMKNALQVSFGFRVAQCTAVSRHCTWVGTLQCKELLILWWRLRPSNTKFKIFLNYYRLSLV